MNQYLLEILKSSQPRKDHHRSFINNLSDENKIKIGTISHVKSGIATHTRGELETK